MQERVGSGHRRHPARFAKVLDHRDRNAQPLDRHHDLALSFVPSGNEWEAQGKIRQSWFGIEPETAFLGALRSKDEVAFELRVKDFPEWSEARG